MPITESKFKSLIWAHHRENRRELPWRRTYSPYKILVSEFMLQQTQVSRVEKKYYEFLRVFPNFKRLAESELSELLRVWQGLGYSRRAKNLRETAKLVRMKYRGRLPSEPERLKELPGIGDYTSKAIACFAFNQPQVFIETNIRTVYLHHFFAEEDSVDDKSILKKIARTLEHERAREWYYALMDYGAYLKSQGISLNSKSKSYTVQSKFEGSLRQVRGEVLKQLSVHPKGLTFVQLSQSLSAALERELDEQLSNALLQLEKEQFLRNERKNYLLC